MMMPKLKYHLILTTDYELFGNGSGCLEKCLLLPTERMISIVEAYKAKLSLFVESLELACIGSLSSGKVSEQYTMVEDQLHRLIATGHHLELHIHPQWLEAKFDRQVWNLSLDKWRLGDLTPTEIRDCITISLSYLNRFKKGSTSIFRAGGWAIQPGEKVVESLSEHAIVIDSTVAPGLFNPSKGDWFDFRFAPDLPFWRVSTDVCEESSTGSIIEVPIATQNIGFISHLRALKESRSQNQFPEGCEGSYAGPNSVYQPIRGRLSKLANIERVMLDFSTLPAWALIETTERYMDRFQTSQTPVPIVEIGHNKNFSQRSGENLDEYLRWANSCPDIVFSDYHTWKEDQDLTLDRNSSVA